MQTKTAFAIAVVLVAGLWFIKSKDQPEQKIETESVETVAAEEPTEETTTTTTEPQVAQVQTPEAETQTAQPVASAPVQYRDPQEIISDRDLEDLVRREFRGASEEIFTRNPDGSYSVAQQADDGGRLERRVDASGQVRNEVWVQKGGHEVTRNYTRDGRVGRLNIGRNDDTATAISVTEDGRIRQRVDRYRDGTQITAVYDDSGRIIRRGRINPDGTTSEIQ